jgi:Protein of unknown function (DUF3108)
MRVAALALCCVSSAVFAAAPVQRIDASYDVSARGIKIAEITEKFTRSGNHYRIESLTRPVGLLAVFKPDTIDVVSEGDFTEQGLRPQHFAYRHSLDTTRNATASFDWSRSILLLDDHDGQRSLTLPAGTQDRLSVQYQFRYIPHLDERKDLVTHITNGSKIDTRHYLIRGRQKLAGPLGNQETLYLSTPPEATAWKTEIWLAVDKGNFPSKIVVTEDSGEQLTQTLTALSVTR